jgi:hypothetical protein
VTWEVTWECSAAWAWVTWEVTWECSAAWAWVTFPCSAGTRTCRTKCPTAFGALDPTVPSRLHGVSSTAGATWEVRAFLQATRLFANPELGLKRWFLKTMVLKTMVLKTMILKTSIRSPFGRVQELCDLLKTRVDTPDGNRACFSLITLVDLLKNFVVVFDAHEEMDADPCNDVLRQLMKRVWLALQTCVFASVAAKGRRLKTNLV